VTKLLYFVNCSSRKLYLGLWVRDEQLEIHIHDEPDPHRIEIRPLERVPVDVLSVIESCIRDGKLWYTLIGHCSGIWLTIPTTSKPDGPVFKFFDG
jgi:hypothetical protein